MFTTYNQLKWCLLFIISIAIFSCGKEEEIPLVAIPIIEEPIIEEEEFVLDSIQQYFVDVALNFEFSSNRIPRLKKWTDDIRIFVVHNGEQELLEELDTIIHEINSLSTSIELRCVEMISMTNFVIVFGSAEDYLKIEPRAKERIESNLGLFWIYWTFQINYGTMYVDVERMTDLECQKHLLREELTQSLGLTNDTCDFPNSMFYQKWTCGTEYSPEDKMLIRYILDPRFKHEMLIDEVIEVFKNL